MPLKGLIERGHEVHFVILHTDPKVPGLNIQVDWLNESSFKAFCHYDLKMPGKLLSIMRYRRTIRELVQKEKYDFIYAHGTSTAVARGISKELKIPFAQRLYGTFLWSKISSLGYFRAAIQHLVEYLSFKTSKQFLLVTNDGSRGDLVWKKIFPNGDSPYSFHYWKNGVSRLNLTDSEISEYKAKLKPGPFVFYCARFDGWKRQDRVLKIIHALKLKGHTVNCYFAGPFDTLGDQYYNHVRSMTEELGLVDQVVFMGSVDKKTIYAMNQLAIASLSLYDVCNLTNVFHEMMCSGALILVKNDEPIMEYIKHGVNGFLINEDSDAIEALEKILSSPDSYKFMRDNVVKSSLAITKSWDERVDDEINLIESLSIKSIQQPIFFTNKNKHPNTKPVNSHSPYNP